MRMQFDLVYRWFDVCVREEIDELRDGKIRDPDRFYEPCFHQTLHRLPCFSVGNRLKSEYSVFIEGPVSIRRRHPPVHQIEIEIVEPQIRERLLTCGTHCIPRVRGVPELARDENILAPHLAPFEPPRKGRPYFFLVTVCSSTINVAVGRLLERILHRLSCFVGCRFPRTQSHKRHRGTRIQNKVMTLGHDPILEEIPI